MALVRSRASVTQDAHSCRYIFCVEYKHSEDCLPLPPANHLAE